jgi:arsenate reductase
VLHTENRRILLRPRNGRPITPMARGFNVLFLCTGNSARSILAEALLNHWGKGRFHGYSAGSFPKGQVHPETLALLQSLRLPTDRLLDFVFTVCDQAAGEVCPIWPGNPVTAHWGIPDPAAADPANIHAAFRDAYRRLDARVKLFTALPLETLDRMAMKREADRIGRIRPDAATEAAS